MSTRNFVHGAALAFGLALAGSSLAQVAPPADPSGMTAEEREAYRTQRQAEMAAMTPEQRAEAQAGRGQGGRRGQQQGQGTMARDGSGSGGQYGKGGGQGGGGQRGGR